MAAENCATKMCTRCFSSKSASLAFYGYRKEGKDQLKSICKECEAARARERRANDPECRAKHVAAVTKYQKKRAADDPVFKAAQAESLRERKLRSRADPIRRERELAKDRAWRKANWDRVKKYKHKTGALQAAHVARRHAAKLRATPAWSETDKIKAMYEEARRLEIETGIEYNVDHIVPLRGRNVCGLHVLANLRIVTSFVNKTKANKLIEELCTA
ncbi:hypothetical protein [Variovorax sp. N23]|uniref:hypothetical protein n=1 Tax=Variovorax sp. N23 TaxID=2980555 RepID=UPI0021C63C2E|nr:hypothetical protein [Variovorax sp. N23]MCU4119299.1 hypothetical protein [Variovorax sp. N23]